MKTLILARHAKSDWSDADNSDHQRPLSARGFKDLETMKARLQNRDIKVDVIISSDAQRAITTAQAYQSVYSCELKTSNDLYLASSLEIIRRAEKLNDTYQCVMLVGHNPGMSEAVSQYQSSIIDMPSGSLVVLRFDVNHWGSLSTDNLVSLDFDYPKKTIS